VGSHEIPRMSLPMTLMARRSCLAAGIINRAEEPGRHRRLTPVLTGRRRPRSTVLVLESPVKGLPSGLAT